MFNSAIIKKKSKDKKNETKKLNPSGLIGIDEIKVKPMEKSIEVEMEPMKGADKIKSGKFEGAKKAKSDDLIGIDLKMAEAKKKPKSDKVDAYTKEKGYYDFSEDKKKINEKYLNKIKSRKGM